MKYTNGQCEKFRSLENRASRIIYQSNQSKVPLLLNKNGIRCSTFIRKCLDNDVCDNFKNYFQLQEHSINTRNNRNILVIPKMRTEFGKKLFMYMGAKVYNELPLEIRKERNFKKYVGLIQLHYKY